MAASADRPACGVFRVDHSCADTCTHPAPIKPHDIHLCHVFTSPQDKLANFYTSSPSHIVAAVCHGPAALLNCYVNGAPLLQGKTVTCFTNSEEKAMKLDAFVPFLLEDRVKERGAVFKPAENMKVRDLT